VTPASAPEGPERSNPVQLQASWFRGADELQQAEDERLAEEALRRYSETAP